ncbi:MAG: 5-oxopent-3-ene-1,2,5-tricarboxylate decarboxylase, partial [Pseudomonadota bacterium]
MKLMMFEQNGSTQLGVIDGARVVNLAACSDTYPASLQALVDAGPDELARVGLAGESAPDAAVLDLSEVKPALPLSRPGKFICVGLNYALHA